mgnify:CR=1 FL=1
MNAHQYECKKKNWKVDLGHSGALVTIVARKTSFTVSMRIDDKLATLALLQPYKEIVHTITADNGKEFAYHEILTKHLACGVYFADTYCLKTPMVYYDNTSQNEQTLKKYRN